MTRVAVIMGGWSSERPVSLSSGRGMAEAARQAGYDVVEIDVTRELAQQLTDAKPDVVLNALHGPWGEDGCVQGVMEILGIPYTHSGVLASALAMDKDKSRAIYVQHGLDVAEGGMYDVEDLARDHIMPPPYVIKPPAEGSSFGVFIVREGANRPPKELTDGTWTFRQACAGRKVHSGQGVDGRCDGRPRHGCHRDHDFKGVLRLHCKIRGWRIAPRPSCRPAECGHRSCA
jgi:D-alanine-D-alanine ligase